MYSVRPTHPTPTARSTVRIITEHTMIPHDKKTPTAQAAARRCPGSSLMMLEGSTNHIIPASKPAATKGRKPPLGENGHGNPGATEAGRKATADGSGGPWARSPGEEPDAAGSGVTSRSYESDKVRSWVSLSWW